MPLPRRRSTQPETELVKYHEKSDLRMMLAWPMLYCGLLGIGLLGFGLIEWSELEGQLALAGSVVLFTLVGGIWYAKNWARHGLLLVSLVICAVQLRAMFRDGWNFDLGRAGLVALFGAAGWYAIGPYSRSHFAQVREILQRERMGKGVELRKPARGLSRPLSRGATRMPEDDRG